MKKTGNEKQATGPGTLLAGGGQRAAGNGQVPSAELRLGSNIAARLVEFAAGITAIVKALPKDIAGRHVASQLFRSGTSGGANYEEARAAESPADFIHKVSIAAKETRESIFWLRLVERSAMTTMAVAPFVSEARELAAILFASARTARERAAREQAEPRKT